MALDRSFVDLNRAATNRLRKLAARLTDQEFRKPIGKDWTVSIVLAHIAFWDARAMYALDASEKSGQVVDPAVDLAVNDFSTALWAAVPPREAARIALATAEGLDLRLEKYPAALLEKVYQHSQRLVLRALHRNEHLDEVEAALKK
jgi:hypothetical protein